MKRLLISLALILSANAWSHDEISKECEENALNKFSEIFLKLERMPRVEARKGSDKSSFKKF